MHPLTPSFRSREARAGTQVQTMSWLPLGSRLIATRCPGM